VIESGDAVAAVVDGGDDVDDGRIQQQ